MKQGLSLTDLAAEVERREKDKRDFKADTRVIAVETDALKDDQTRPLTRLSIEGIDDDFGVNDVAHGQIALHTGIPKKYYDRLRVDYPGLYDTNVNTLLLGEPSRRMVRTLDGQARAFLSDRYRTLDHYDLLESILPVLSEYPDLQIASTQVTDTKLYLKVVFPKIEAEVGLNDIVQAGLVISNSEVGLGSLSVTPMVFRLVCLNGMIAAKGIRKTHIGRASQEEGAYEVYRDETLEADDKAFWMKTQDIVRSAVNEAAFTQLVDKLKDAKEDKIEAPVQTAVEEITSKLRLHEKESDGVLKHLIEGGDLSRYGMIQAITRTSQNVKDYDRATELEEFGGKVLEMPRKEWREVALA